MDAIGNNKVETERDTFITIDTIYPKLKQTLLQRNINIALTDISHFCKWDGDSLTYLPSESVPKSSLEAVEEIKFEKTEYTGKNPRIVTNIKIKLYDKVRAINSIMNMLENDGVDLED